MDVFIMLLVNGLSEGALVFLMAAGLAIILGLLGIVNFAHGTMFLWGGYVSIWLYGKTENFLLAILGAVIVGFLMGLLFERLFLRPIYGNVTAQILITLGLMIVFTDLVRLLWGPSPLAAVRPPFLDGTWVFGEIIISRYRIFLILVGFLVVLGIHLLINKTRVGMIIRAGIQSPEMVQALGINIRAYFSLVFAAGSALAALGGALFVPLVGAVWSGMGINNQVLAFVVVIVGGMGSFIGTAVGSVILGLTVALAAWFLPAVTVAVPAILMILVLLFKPAGLFGLAVRK